MADDLTCPVCASEAAPAGFKQSTVSARRFSLASCSTCGFSFVVDPRTDFANIYDADYYAGRGADPDVNYDLSVADPLATQRYEWQGVFSIVSSLTTVDRNTRWLDFGCGLGGLVRYVSEQGVDVVGHDEGYGAKRLQLDGLPYLAAADFERHQESFDVITAVEVIEHTIDPIATLRDMAGLLKPGGLLFLTTGNAEPFRGKLESWRYVNPDVHISFFEPRTLELAMRRVGLTPTYPGYVPGYNELIRAKILRTLGRKRSSRLEELLPWGAIGRLADRRFEVSAHPVGRKDAASPGLAPSV